MTLCLCLQEAGRLPPSAGCRWFSPDERARLEVCVHIHPGVLPLPRGERPGQNQKANINLWEVKSWISTHYWFQVFKFIYTLHNQTVPFTCIILLMKHVNVNILIAAQLSFGCAYDYQRNCSPKLQTQHQWIYEFETLFTAKYLQPSIKLTV